MIPLRKFKGELFESMNGAPEIKLEFNGATYSRPHDKERLTGQIQRIFDCMKDNRFRTLDEIAQITKDPHASISAQLRHLRKERFGGHTVNKRARGEREKGLFEYQLICDTRNMI